MKVFVRMPLLFNFLTDLASANHWTDQATGRDYIYVFGGKVSTTPMAMTNRIDR